MDFQMEEKYLDYVLVPSGLLVLAIYHCWLLITIIYHPRRTVIGLNIASRHRWIYHMMNDPQKNGILAVQSLRNNLMASTVLASIAITLSSLISAVVTNAASSKSATTSYTIHQIKYFAVLICFLIAFFCNMQTTRYYAHVSLLVNVPCPEEPYEFIEYVAQKLHRGGLFWSLGLRAFYFAFPLLLWTFGPIPMFVCSCMLAFVLYFLDTTSSYSSGQLPRGFVQEENGKYDVESIGESIETVRSGDSTLYGALLGSSNLGSSSDGNFLSPALYEIHSVNRDAEIKP